MGTLGTFLRTEAERLRAEAPTREAKKQDWVRAVTGLLNQIQEWVRQADTENVLELRVHSPKAFSYEEEGLGEYLLPRLQIQLDTRKVLVIGKARNVVDRIQLPGETRLRQADGLVVITDHGMGDRFTGAAKYYLYRIAGPDGDRWFIRSPLESDVAPFDRERLEAILVSLLK